MKDYVRSKQLLVNWETIEFLECTAEQEGVYIAAQATKKSYIGRSPRIRWMFLVCSFQLTGRIEFTKFQNLK